MRILHLYNRQGELQHRIRWPHDESVPELVCRDRCVYKFAVYQVDPKRPTYFQAEIVDV